MSEGKLERGERGERHDSAPGDEAASGQEFGGGVTGYVVGLLLALALTAGSFYMVSTDLVWGPAIPAALIVLAVAQMGIHLVFFLHITTGPDNTNNVLALAFGVLIVLLVVFGSMWIMDHLSHQLMPMGEMMKRMR
ncbi:cytochrome o ubiquinol oxidase subunit IV [Sphingomonas aracearum]|uniref:cytochrome o ubiquinol oxidase subunit IV n=1 Tax=Sphingomonas aracearum TaxID=2283317 RepID=UPI001EF0E304|nr:cytochrome o ubiquinol oxidase subunit IV [Sphingomonas aracearum]